MKAFSLETLIKSLAIWAIILTLAVINGALREALLIPNVGAMPGLIFSGLLLSCLILTVTYLFLPWLGVNNAPHLVLVGLFWLILTLIFESSFGLARGLTIAEILSAYTFKGGNIWPVVLMVTTTAPWVAAKFRGLL